MKYPNVADDNDDDENGPEVCTCGSGELFPSWLLELVVDSLTNVLLGCHFIIGTL